MMFLVILLISFVLEQSGGSSPCDLQRAKYGFVCKCTADKCDYLKEPKLENEDSWFAVTSSKSGLRFSLAEGNFSGSKNIVINDYNESSYGENVDAVMLDNKDSFFGILTDVKKSEFIVKVYAPFWFLVKSKPLAIHGSRNIFKYIAWIRQLPEDVQQTLRPVIQNNSYFFHPENILLSMITDEDAIVRSDGYTKILLARNEATGCIRQMFGPQVVNFINFESDSYFDMINWNKFELTEPPCLQFYTQEHLEALQCSQDVIELPGLNLSQSWRKPSITIDRSKTFQKIVGFGGALTGSVAYLLEKLENPLQNHVYKSYFHKNGIAFNILRTSIGGCDFDLEPWAYNDIPENDKDLTNFTKLDQRDLLKIDQIKEIKVTSELDELKIMAAAWSPPRWMKTNHEWTGFSNLKEEYYQTWANYHLRYLELMLDNNITIWAISTGNEPSDGTFVGSLFVKFMSLGWTASNQAIFLEDNLGPTLKKSQFKNVLIFGNDDQRFSYPKWFIAMNSSRPRSLDYLDGLAVHWYYDESLPPNLIDDTLKLMPDKLLLNTEACVGSFPGETHAPELGSWERGERYARSLFEDLQHNFNGWIDWNLLLNEKGGPNYVNNTVDAPIIVNTTNYAEFYKQPIFYVMGHFSKFISQHSERIAVKISSLQSTTDAVGFKRPDNKIVLIISNSAPFPQDININDSIRGMFTINAPARSLLTVVYK